MTADEAKAALSHIIQAMARGELPRTLVIDGQAVTVTIRRANPTPCEVDLLAVIVDHQPITTSRILDELEHRGAIHGETTVRKTLARLVRLGRVISSRSSPRGYRTSTDIVIELRDRA